MDKKLNRTILFDKSSQKTKEPAAESRPKVPAPKIDRAGVPQRPDNATDVAKWINEHPYFKWSTMCRKIGLDKGNFKRTLESPEPSIPQKHLSQIVEIIKEYGYAK